MTFTVAGALDAHIAAIETDREPDGRWHPSSIFGCARKAMYDFRGEDRKAALDSRSKRVFRMGHLVHDFIQGAVQMSPEVVAALTEVSITNPDLNIEGHGDQLIQFRDGTWELEEYKSIKSTAFKYGELPKPEHVNQAVSYALTLRDHGSPDLEAIGEGPLGDKLTGVRITYASKDDLLISEHLLSLSSSPLPEQEVRERIDLLERHKQNGTLPPRLPMVKGKRDWRCGYCPFAVLCWTIDPEGVE